MPELPSPHERRSVPEHEEELHAELRRNAPVFAVGPIRARSRVPWIVIVGLVVGVGAFVAGIGVASAGPASRPAPTATSSGAGETTGSTGEPAAAVVEPGTTAAGPDAAAPSSVPGPPLAAAGSSPFVTAFRPIETIRATPGGAACTAGAPSEKEVPRSRRDGPRLTFQRTWLAWCPIPEERRQTFLVEVLRAFVGQIPADTFGFSTTDTGPGDALYPYAEPPFAGTVAVTADAAGTGFAIAIVLQEWRSDATR